MYIGHSFSNRIIDQNRLTIRRLNDQIFSRNIGDHGISGFWLVRMNAVAGVAFGNIDNGCSMYLIGEYKLAMPDAV